MWDKRTVPPQARAAMKVVEGLSLPPYDDGSGYWTIGYGSRRDLAGNPVTRATKPITELQANQMLDRDLQSALKSVADDVKVPITDAQASALLLLAYNLGDLSVAAKTLLGHIHAGRWTEAANRFSVYINSAGKPELGLRRRRWMEGAIFLGADPAEAYRRAWAGIKKVTDWPPLPTT